MFSLQKYIVPAFQIPDAGGAAPPDSLAPPPAAADATAGSLTPPTAVDAPTAAADPIIEPPAPPPEPVKAPPPKWMLDRITETTAKKQEAERRAEAAERRATEAEALAQRLQSNPPSPEGRPNTNPVQPIPAPNDPNFRSAVAQEAQRQRFYDDTVAVRSAGFSQFGAPFQESLQILAAVNATSDEFIADVMATDKAKAHVLLERLAKDPEKTVALVNMDSRSRIAELTRMTMVAPQASIENPAAAPKAQAPNPKVSRAPAPPPPIEPSASKTIDWRSDEASDDEFTRGFEETMKKRSARR